MAALLFLLPVALAVSPVCQSLIDDVLTAKDETAAKMLYYSGRGFDDLGNYDACNDLPGTKYVLLQGDYMEAMFFLGFCGPSVCTKEDYSELANWLFEQLHGEKYFPNPNFKFYFSKEYNDESMSAGAVVAVVFVVFLCICAIAGTLIDHMSSGQEQLLGPVSSFLLNFSFITNGGKLFTLPTTWEPMQCFNGLRVLCIAVVCYGHTYLYQFQAAVVSPQQVLDCFAKFSLRPAITGQYIVDIFFIMSAFLLSYFTLDVMNSKRGRMNWKMFILHRIIRLVPIYYFAVLWYVVLLRWVGSGAQWPIFKQLTPKGCDEYWWSNLLFINNFAPADDYSCMGWTWYIANDMQFYVVSPIVLILYFRKKLWGYAGCITLIAVNVLYTSSMSAAHNYTPMLLEGLGKKQQYLDIYIKPYARCSTFFLGIMVGFMFRTYSDMEKEKAKAASELTDSSLIPQKPRIDTITRIEYTLIAMYHKPVVRYVAYAIGTALILTIALAPYDLDHNGNDQWPQSQKTAFLTFCFLTFGVGFVLHLIPMLLGYHRYLSAILSFRLLAPFARVSFSVYVFHPIFIYLSAFTRNQAVYIQPYEIFYHWLGNLTLAFFFGTIASLMIESPVMLLEKKLFHRK